MALETLRFLPVLHLTRVRIHARARIHEPPPFPFHPSLFACHEMPGQNGNRSPALKRNIRDSLVHALLIGPARSLKPRIINAEQNQRAVITGATNDMSRVFTANNNIDIVSRVTVIS